MRLVVEGVERQETMAAIRGLGCEAVQGYLHARPMPAGAFLGWLTSRTGAAARPRPSGTT